MTIRRCLSVTDFWLGIAFMASVIVGGVYLIAKYVVAPSLIPIAIIMQPRETPKVPKTGIDVRVWSVAERDHNA